MKIDDPAYALKQGRQQSITKAKKYAVYVDTLTPISDIITALREYVQSYYTTEENTLKVDVCFES